MEISETRIKGVHTINVPFFWDERGFFGEALNVDILEAKGLPFRMRQCNLSMSRRSGIVRGMHWQAEPDGQAKLILCVRGSAWDVAVDVRSDSPTYGEHVGLKLWSRPTKSGNVRGLLVPKGCGHGWQALEDGSELLYFVDGPWSRESERGLRPQDPALAIAWPLPPVVPSARDASWPLFEPGLRRGAIDI